MLVQSQYSLVRQIIDSFMSTITRYHHYHHYHHIISAITSLKPAKAKAKAKAKSQKPEPEPEPKPKTAMQLRVPVRQAATRARNVTRRTVWPADPKKITQPNPPSLKTPLCLTEINSACIIKLQTDTGEYSSNYQ